VNYYVSSLTAIDGSMSRDICSVFVSWFSDFLTRVLNHDWFTLFPIPRWFPLDFIVEFRSLFRRVLVDFEDSEEVFVPLYVLFL